VERSVTDIASHDLLGGFQFHFFVFTPRIHYFYCFIWSHSNQWHKIDNSSIVKDECFATSVRSERYVTRSIFFDFNFFIIFFNSFKGFESHVTSEFEISFKFSFASIFEVVEIAGWELHYFSPNV